MLLLYFQDLGRLSFFHLNAQNKFLHIFFFLAENGFYGASQNRMFLNHLRDLKARE